MTANQIARLVVKIESSGVTKVAAQIEMVDTAGRKAGKSTDDLDKRFRRLGSSAGGASGGIASLSSGVAALGGGFGKLAATAVVLAPALLAVSGAAVAIGAALAPLVGLAGAAAVGLSAFAQAAGVVALASMGVGDALKEQMSAAGKAGKAAATGADQQRSAARAISAAQDGVRQAHEGVRTATEGLTRAEQARAQALKALGPAQQQARRDLEDMHAALSGAMINERQAVQTASDAWKALGEAQNPVDVGRLADAQAGLTASTLNEQRAVRSLVDARQALEDLMKPADALSVADAQDAVSDATRGETRAALQLAKARTAAEKAAADPTMSDADKAQAKLDLADAENAIGDASRASAHAQEQLTKLQAGPDPKDVAKAKQNIADAEQGVADATAATAKAQKDVQDASKGADPAAVAKAQLDVAAATQALADATRDRLRLQKDVAAADKAGINGSAGVVAAREQIADADRQVVDAERQLVNANRDVKKAMQAVKDAQLDAKTATAGLAAANVDLNEKFNDLPPAAQAFVRVLQGLKPKLDEVRAVAAAGLFPGVTAGITEAMKNFEPLKRVVGETATVIGGLATRAGELVGSKGFGKDLETIGGRNAKIIDRVGRAAIYVGDAIRHLLVVAGPLTTWLAKVTLEWAKNIDGAVKAGRESGKLAAFFQKTRNTLIRVASIVGNLGEAFFNVGKQAAPFGRDMLASIDKVSGKFKEWTESVGGQKALQDFFKQSADLASKLMPALGGILGSLGSLAFSVLPAYVAILKVLGPLAGPLVQAFVLYKLALTGVAVATNIVTAAQWLWNAALAANPITLVVIAIAALVAAFVIAYKKSETFRDIVNAVWDSIKTVALPVIEWLATAIPKAWDAVRDATVAVWDFLKPYLEAIWKAIKTFVTTYFEVYKTIITAAWDVIKTVTTTLWDWFGPYLKGVFGILKALFTGLFDALKEIVSAAWSVIKTGVTAAWDAITAVAKTAWGGLKSAADVSWGLIKDAILDPIRAARDAIGGKDGIWEKIKSVAQTAWDGLAGMFDKGKDTLVNAITAPFKEGVKLVGGFAKKILEVVDLIPGVDMKKPIADIDSTLKSFDKANGLARGGAFARTGGLVSSPITLMGEEAPRHPEFVIPTNPAYRKRAQGLLGQAAGAIGFAEGGINQYNHVYPRHNLGEPGVQIPPDDVMAIAQQAGLPGRAFEQIAHGESDYHPGIIGHDPGGTLGYGMWQNTTGVNGADFEAVVQRLGGWAQQLNPFKNAAASKWLYDRGGLSHWFGTKYLGKAGSEGNVDDGGIFSKIGNAVGSVVGSVTDAISGFVSKLPSTDGLGMFAGLGTVVLGNVKDWIEDKVKGLFPGGGSSSDVPSGSSGVQGLGMFDGRQVAKWIIPELEYARSHGWKGHLTSGYRPPDQVVTGPVVAPQGMSEHQGTQYPHGAVDFGGPFDAAGLANKLAFIEASQGYAGPRLLSALGFRDDGHMSGTGHYMGGVYGGLLGSYENGTPFVPQTGPYLLHRGEKVTPAGQQTGPMVHIEHATFSNEEDVEVFARRLGWQLAR